MTQNKKSAWEVILSMEDSSGNINNFSSIFIASEYTAVYNDVIREIDGSEAKIISISKIGVVNKIL